MTTIYLIRHGESTANVGGMALPNADIPLTEKGREQAHELAEKLPLQPSEVVVSNFIRTLQTAQPWLDKLGLTPREETLIREFNMLGYSMIAGKTGAGRAPIALKYWQDPDLQRRCGDDGETFAEFHQRVEEFLNQLSHYPDGSVLFTHGMFIRLVMWRLLGYPMTENAHLGLFYQFFRGLRVPNTAVYRLTFANGRDDANLAFVPELSPKLYFSKVKEISP